MLVYVFCCTHKGYSEDDEIIKIMGLGTPLKTNDISNADVTFSINFCL